MQRKLYTHRDGKKLIAAILAIGALVAANYFWLTRVSPNNIFVEAVGIILFFLLVLIVSAWLIGKVKWGILVAGLLIYLLVLNRVGWFGWPAVGVGMIAAGLISLIN